MRGFSPPKPAFRGLAEEEEDETVKVLVLSALQEALNSTPVQRQLVAALDLHTQLQAVFVESKHLLIQQLIADLNLGSRLTALLADRKIQEQLAAHIDVETLLSSVDLEQKLRNSLAGVDVFGVIFSPSTVAATKRALASDEALCAKAAIALNGWVFAGLLLALYAAAVAELSLCLFGWTMGLALSATAAFDWAWLPLLLHTVRVAVLGVAAPRLPTTHGLVRQLSSLPPAPLASSPEAAAAPKQLPQLLLAPLGALGRPWLLLSAACLLIDGVAFAAAALTIRSTAAAAAMPVALGAASTTELAAIDAAATTAASVESASDVLLLLLWACFVALDLLPLACWPLLRWALPEQHASALRAALLARLPSTLGSSGSSSIWPSWMNEDAVPSLDGRGSREASRSHDGLRPMQSWLDASPTLRTGEGAAADRV